jgi:hypothetical protein|tara:strand:- start:952 stop:1608 length:657 start_codon:yes stop_codon:yes gene_type:complete
LKLTPLVFLSTILFFLSGCLSNADGPKIYRDATGVVLTSGGDPVADADIHIRNHFNPGGFLPELIGDTVRVNFSAPTRTLYRASIYRHDANSLLATFFEDTLESGDQELIIPDSLLSNGILGFQVSTSARVLGGSLFVVNKPDSLLVGTLPFTETSAEGEFRLNSSYLAIGSSFNASSGSFKITDSLQIMVVQDSVITSKRAVKLKANEQNFFEITVD